MHLYRKIIFLMLITFATGFDLMAQSTTTTVRHNPWELIIYRPENNGDLNYVRCWIKLEDADVKAAAKDMARIQFAQYGMSNIPEEYLDNYAEEMLKKPEQVDQFVNQAADRKLMTALKDVVTLDTKTITFDELQKL